MKRARPAPAFEPHACVVLGVDTAQCSGWCITVRGLYVSSGEGDLLRQTELARSVCASALQLGACNRLPVVLAFERPFRGNTQGQYIGTWKAAWAAAGGVKTRTVGVYPPTWRARILGRGYARADRKEARRAEQVLAAQVAGRAVGGDEAPAVGIARWASFAGEVAAKLPKRSKAA